jgi:diguanylate cyclase (GGDEF)-like protein
MRKRIIKTYPYPINQIIDYVIDYGEIVDYNQMFNEIFTIEEEKLQAFNVKQLIFSKDRDSFLLDFEDGTYRRLLIQLNDEYLKNPMNNSYDSYIYKMGNLYCFLGKKDLHDTEEIMNDLSLLTNKLSNISRDLSKKNLALKKANERIENLLRHDKLTGLSNRRHFMESIEKEIATANRYQSPLTLVMCDLDNFKKINDTYGHDLGDLVLKTLGKVLDQETRKGELAARIGGDEFAIVLSQTPLEKGKIFAERIRKSVSEISIAELLEPITLSIGLTEFKENESFESFFKRVDMALYKAKDSGRNKVCSLD